MGSRICQRMILILKYSHLLHSNIVAKFMNEYSRSIKCRDMVFIDVDRITIFIACCSTICNSNCTITTIRIMTEEGVNIVVKLRVQTMSRSTPEDFKVYWDSKTFSSLRSGPGDWLYNHSIPPTTTTTTHRQTFLNRITLKSLHLWTH